MRKELANEEDADWTKLLPKSNHTSPPIIIKIDDTSSNTNEKRNYNAIVPVTLNDINPSYLFTLDLQKTPLLRAAADSPSTLERYVFFKIKH